MTDKVKIENTPQHTGIVFWLPALILIVFLLISLWYAVHFDAVNLPELVGALNDDLGAVSNRLIFYIMAWMLGAVATLVCSVFLLFLLFRRSLWFHRLFIILLCFVLLGSGISSVLEFYVFQLGGETIVSQSLQLSIAALIAFIMYAAASKPYARVFRPGRVFQFGRATLRAADGPVGAGGWLIVPLLTFVLTFSGEVAYTIVLLPDLVGPLTLAADYTGIPIGFRLAGFAPFFVGIIATTLFVRCHRWFPGVLTLYFIVCALCHWFTVAWYELLYYDVVLALEDMAGEPQLSSGYCCFLAELLVAVLLALYLRFSKRVRNTFRRETKFDGEEGQPTFLIVN